MQVLLGLLYEQSFWIHSALNYIFKWQNLHYLYQVWRTWVYDCSVTDKNEWVRFELPIMFDFNSIYNIHIGVIYLPAYTRGLNIFSPQLHFIYVYLQLIFICISFRIHSFIRFLFQTFHFLNMHFTNQFIFFFCDFVC